MLTYKTVLAALLLLIIYNGNAQAQTYDVYEFEAEIVILEDEKSFFADKLALGQKIRGQFVWNVNAKPNTPQGNSRNNYFALDDGISGIGLSGAGWNFNSVRKIDPGMDTIGCYTHLFSTRSSTPIPDVYRCDRQIRMVSNFCALPGVQNPEDGRIEFKCYKNLCPGEIDVNQLPQNIRLSDWRVSGRSAIWVNITSKDPNAPYRIAARVNSIRKNSARKANVTGKIFIDTDEDCEFTAEPAMTRNMLVQFSPGPYYVMSDRLGFFETYLRPDAYTATVVPSFPWQDQCPEVEFTLDSDNLEQTLDLGLTASKRVKALEVSVASAMARPGFELTYEIEVRNIGTETYSGDVTFNYDMILQDFSAIPAPDNYTPSTAVWAVTNLALGQALRFSASFTVPPDEKLLGTTICAMVTTAPKYEADPELLRMSQDEICQEIRGAYDPNDIQVFSGVHSADGPITQDQKILTYLIRFQNEGNEDAINVRVLDKLTEFHRIDKLRLGISSHDYEFNFTDQGKLEWVFNNINLPPKERDEPGSNGFIKYEVFLKDELAIGTEIPNSAAIYFDFNSPVITNTVVSRISGPAVSVGDADSVDEIEIYPNPARDKLTLKFQESQFSEITIVNPLGQVVKRQSGARQLQTLDIRDLPQGTYFLRIQTASGTNVRTVNISR